MADQTPDTLLWTWLAFVDVNSLSDAEAEVLACYDIEDDAQLGDLTESWLRPKFLEMNEVSRGSFRDLLTSADIWPRDQVKAVFDKIKMPSGQRIRDIPRFIRALKVAARA